METVNDFLFMCGFLKKDSNEEIAGSPVMLICNVMEKSRKKKKVLDKTLVGKSPEFGAYHIWSQTIILE
jgi:hypothetical protein